MKMRIFFPVVLIMGFVFACKKPVIEPSDVVFDTGYFPMELNTWKIYQVSAITIDEATNLYDTSEYQVKEIYANWYVDGEGDSMIVIKRYMRESESGGWTELNSWITGIKENKVIQSEENIKYVKLNFPVLLHKEWDGDALNAEDTIYNYMYEYTTVDSIENYGELYFDSVITITQKYKTTLIDKVDFKEKYQYNLGLIYKKQIDLYDDSVEYGVPWEERVSKGTFYYKTIIDYGKD